MNKTKQEWLNHIMSSICILDDEGIPRVIKGYDDPMTLIADLYNVVSLSLTEVMDDVPEEVCCAMKACMGNCRAIKDHKKKFFSNNKL